jgi:hypothetical protein
VGDKSSALLPAHQRNDVAFFGVVPAPDEHPEAEPKVVQSGAKGAATAGKGTKREDSHGRPPLPPLLQLMAARQECWWDLTLTDVARSADDVPIVPKKSLEAELNGAKDDGAVLFGAAEAQRHRWTASDVMEGVCRTDAVMAALGRFVAARGVGGVEKHFYVPTMSNNGHITRFSPGISLPPPPPGSANDAHCFFMTPNMVPQSVVLSRVNKLYACVFNFERPNPTIDDENAVSMDKVPLSSMVAVAMSNATANPPRMSFGPAAGLMTIRC